MEKFQKHNYYGNPVYKSDDYTELNRLRCRTQMPDGMYIGEYYDGRPCEPMRDFGALYIGLHNQCVPCPVLAQ